MIVIDPICKMKLEEKETKFKSEYKGETYYFYVLLDKKKFDENPEKYMILRVETYKDVQFRHKQIDLLLS